MPRTRVQSFRYAEEGKAASVLVDMKLGQQAANHEGVVFVVGDTVFFPLNGFMVDGVIVSLSSKQKTARIRLQNSAWSQAKYDVVTSLYNIEPRYANSPFHRL